MDELEAELQRANNKVCHTGHLLNQMTIKVKTKTHSEVPIKTKIKQNNLFSRTECPTVGSVHLLKSRSSVI